MTIPKNEMKKQKIKKVKAWNLAFTNLPKTLKILVWCSVIIVVIYHLQQYCEQVQFRIMTVTQKWFVLFKTSSEFLSKLSYAVITSTIFYYLTQQLPKEKKRILVVESLSNMFPFVQIPFWDFEFDLISVQQNTFSADEYNKMCEMKLIDSPVRPEVAGCISWEKFTIEVMEKMTKKISEISQLNDLLDTNTLILLQNIQTSCITVTNILSLRGRAMQSNENLGYVSPILFGIRKKLALFGESATKFIGTYSPIVTFKSLY